MRGDHREAIAEHDDDRALDAGQRRRQHDVLGHVDPAAGEVVVPVDPPQVAGVGGLRVGVADAVVVDRRRIGELGERRQADAALAEALDAVGQRRRRRRRGRRGRTGAPARRRLILAVGPGGSVLGPTWRRATRTAAPRPAHASRTLSTAFAVCIQRRRLPLARRHQPLAPDQLDAGMVLGVAARRRLELVDRADAVAGLAQRGDDVGDLLAGGVVVDGGTEALELVRGHRVVAAAGEHPVGAEVHVVARRRPRTRRTRPGASCTAAGSWRSAGRCTAGTGGTGRTPRARRTGRPSAPARCPRTSPCWPARTPWCCPPRAARRTRTPPAGTP